jgi:uncharacterized DUF497 family protein
MEYQWDQAKAAANLKKHGVASDAALALEDPHALTIGGPDAIDESRFICLGADPSGRILITVFAPRGRAIRIISSRRPAVLSAVHTRKYDEKTLRFFKS